MDIIRETAAGKIDPFWWETTPIALKSQLSAIFTFKT
jgi:hypothetical protein